MGVPFFGFILTLWVTPSPAQVSAIHMNQQFMVDGVNCHGASLVAAGVLKNLSYVGRKEIEGVLYQFCRPLDEPQAGAIGYVGGDPMVNHSFYVLAQNKRLQKRSAETTSLFRVVEGAFPNYAKYYFCPVPTLESQCGNEIDSYILKVAQFTSYYEGLLTELREFQNRENVYAEMMSLREPTPTSVCHESLMRAKLRLISLMDLGNILNGQGLIMYQKNSPMKQRGKN